MEPTAMVTFAPLTHRELILTLNKHADDQFGLWLCGGAGQYTDVILQTVRDPIPLRASALSLFIIFDKV
jgi:hypothetical protein